MVFRSCERDIELIIHAGMEQISRVKQYIRAFKIKLIENS